MIRTTSATAIIADSLPRQLTASGWFAATIEQAGYCVRTTQYGEQHLLVLDLLLSDQDDPDTLYSYSTGTEIKYPTVDANGVAGNITARFASVCRALGFVDKAGMPYFPDEPAVDGDIFCYGLQGAKLFPKLAGLRLGVAVEFKGFIKEKYATHSLVAITDLHGRDGAGIAGNLPDPCRSVRTLCNRHSLDLTRVVQGLSVHTIPQERPRPSTTASTQSSSPYAAPAPAYTAPAPAPAPVPAAPAPVATAPAPAPAPQERPAQAPTPSFTSPYQPEASAKQDDDIPF